MLRSNRWTLVMVWGRGKVLSSEVMVSSSLAMPGAGPAPLLEPRTDHRWRTKCLIIRPHKPTVAQISTLRSSLSIWDGRVVVPSRGRGWTHIVRSYSV